MSRYQPKQFEDRHLAVVDIEAISGEQPDDGSFPPWPTFTPILASVLQADRNSYGEWSFHLETVRFVEHEQPYEKLDELIRARGLITFNGAGFDLPVLMLNAQKDRCFQLPALTAAATQPKWGNVHYDLAQRCSYYGAARGGTLEQLCDALGIPAKLDVHGQDVAGLCDRGEINRIEDYCSTDVAATLMLYAHQRASETGDPLTHASLITQFVRWAQQDGRDCLRPFTDFPDLSQLLPISLLGQIAAAEEVAAINSEWRDKKALDASFTEAVSY